MRKTKLSFDLFARQHGNDGLFARFYRHPGSAAKAGLKGVHRQDCRRQPPTIYLLYQEKAVTPTPLKDIFTSIWAGPYVHGASRHAERTRPKRWKGHAIVAPEN